MHIFIEEAGGRRIVKIEGRLDAVSSPTLESRLTGLLEGNHKVVIINFSKINYLSSAGLRLLLSATKKFKSKQGELVCCSINEEVMEIIKMASFERILTIYPDEKSALAALQDIPE
jgi:anti-anti-sigma factor